MKRERDVGSFCIVISLSQVAFMKLFLKVCLKRYSELLAASKNALRGNVLSWALSKMHDKPLLFKSPIFSFNLKCILLRCSERISAVSLGVRNVVKGLLWHQQWGKIFPQQTKRCCV